MSVKLEIKGVIVIAVCGYAPQVECEKKKEKFWIEVEEMMERTPRDEKVVIGADFNGRVVEGDR